MGRMVVGRVIGAVTAAVLVAVVAACGIEPASAGRGPRSIVIDTANYPSTLDPGKQYDTDSYSVYRNIFDQLLRRDPVTNEVVPWLATGWRQEDPVTWRFAMRPGVRFSDGTPLTAADAAFSIRRILDRSFGSQQYANFSTIAAAVPQGDDLVITTKVPSPTLLSYLTTLSVVPEAYVRAVGDERFATAPIGSGPYVLASATQGSEVVLRANPDWWRGTPAVADATFRAVPSVASRIADLQSRQADLVTSLTPDAADQVRRDPTLGVAASPTERVAYLAFNVLGGGPVEDPRVRHAVEAAIDYRALVENLQRDYARRVNSMVTPLAVGYDPSRPLPRHDPDEARRLLAEAGATGATLVIPTSPSFDPQVVQAIQADLAAVGLNAEIRNSDQSTYLSKVQDPAHDWGSIRFGRWSCSCLDTDGVIYPLFHTGGIWSSFSDPGYDAIVEQARRTTDPAARAALYGQAFDVLDRALPGIGLYQTSAIYGVGARLEFSPDASESLFLDRMAVQGT